MGLRVPAIRLMGLGMVVHCWAVIGLAMAAAIWQPWLIILAVPIIGARQLGPRGNDA